MRKFGAISLQDEFANTYQNAKRWHCEQAVVYFLPNNDDKFAVVASKKIGKAVCRNRAKRRLRSAFVSLSGELEFGIYIIVAKKGVLESTFLQLQKNLRWSFKKVGALK
ncbi:MAG: ribonuclease P protein component [Campylobacter sp.]|nr:ribonuclease P protein component [Campylobacter sp.]